MQRNKWNLRHISLCLWRIACCEICKWWHRAINSWKLVAWDQCSRFNSTYRANELTQIAEMNQVASGGVKWGVSKIFSLLSVQGNLSHEQRLRLKDDGRPCPPVTIKNRTSVGVYDSYSWMCGDAERNTYFCWPCLVMGDLSKLRFLVCTLILVKTWKIPLYFFEKRFRFN